MADTASILQTYFVQAADASPPSRPLPATFTGCKVTPLIDGNAYFGDLTATLATIGTGATPADNAGHFIYIARWLLDLLGGEVHAPPGSVPGSTGAPELINTKPFALDGPDGTNRLIDLLKKKARDGVDVRVLGWVSWSVMANHMAQSAANSVRDINVATISSLHALRQEPALAKQCCMNIIGHSAGGVHTKLVIAGTPATAVGYTGGLDFRSDRHSVEHHAPGSWHDVQAKVEGPAVQALYDFYAQMWNEVLLREVKTYRVGRDKVPSFVAGTMQVPARDLPAATLGSHHVQSLRTAPEFKYATFNMLPEGDPISFASQGLFEVELAWRKAILAAEQYIYMEDQGFWSVDVFKWIKQALENRPNLKVILATGVKDPADPELPAFNIVALQEGLLTLTPAQLARIRIFGRNVVMHAKTTLIDDHWAIIGSANCMRRSLYTDLEHSVAVIDDLDVMVREYRVQLWGGHFNLPPSERSKLDSLELALNVWNASWGTGGSGVSLPSYWGQISLPPSPVTLSDDEKEKYDRYYDPDSRNAWGGCLP